MKKKKKPQAGVPKVLQALPPERLAAVDNLLLADRAVDKVVDLIQKEWLELTDMKATALRMALYRYKERVIVPRQAAIAAKLTGDTKAAKLGAMVERIEVRLQPLDAMENVIKEQMARVNRLKAMEDKMPALLDSQTKNLALLSEMLNKYANLQLEVGMLSRVPKKANITFDISEEERRFLESKKVLDLEASVTLKALRLLHEEADDSDLVQGSTDESGSN